MLVIIPAEVGLLGAQHVGFQGNANVSVRFGFVAGQGQDLYAKEITPVLTILKVHKFSY